MEWYYILGIISYGIFILQFILSSVGFGDSDIDLDLDGDSDFDVSDLLSFKGLVHFLMGFSGWIIVKGTPSIFTICVAIVVGILFMIGLYYIYRLCMKFNSEPTIKSGIELIGETATVYVPYLKDKYICLLQDGREIICSSELPIKEGTPVRINNFLSGIYYISQI